MKKIYRILDDLSPSNMKLKDLPRKPDGLYNMHFNEYGQIEKRKGYALYDQIAAGGPKIVGMHRYYKRNKDKIFLVAWEDGIYVLPDDLKAAVEIETVIANSDTYFADFDNHSYFVNGVNGVLKCSLSDAIAGAITSSTEFTRSDETWTADVLTGGFVFSYKSDATDGIWTEILGNNATIITVVDGTLFTNADHVKILTVKTVGVTVPTAKPGVGVSGSDGDLGDGLYKFCYTYVDADEYEGNPSPESNAVPVTGTEHVDVTLANSGTLTKVIYRTAVGGAIFYKDGTETATEINYDSKNPDSKLGDMVKVDHTAPPSTSHLITKRRNKLYVANEDYLYPSYTSDVEYFPILWAMRTGNSQKIMGLLEQLTALPVTTEDSIERLVGTDEDNFEFKNSYSTEGCIATRSYVNCDNLIVYLGFNGINYFDGVSSGVFSEELNEYIRTHIVKDKAYLSCATYWNNKYILCFTTSGDVPNETVWYDLKNKTYGVYSYDFSCFAKWDKGDDGLRLFGGSNTVGEVYEITGTDDNDSAITCYDSPEPIDLGMPDIWKQWYNIYIKVKSTTATRLTFYYTLDDNNETSNEKTMERDDITFVDGGEGEVDTITTEAGDFLTTGFLAEDIITISGTSLNNRIVTIVSVEEKTITIPTGQLNAEAERSAVIKRSLTLEADTTKWYKIDLGGGGQRARALKPRPEVSDKYDVTYMGYAFVYDIEAPEY